MAYATKANSAARDGILNSPYNTALVRWIKEPNLELLTMFRKIQSDVLRETDGEQRPEITVDLPDPYILNPPDAEWVLWDEIKNWEDIEVLQKFADAHPDSPRALLAQRRIEALRDALEPRAWEQVKNSSDPEALRSFASLYPQSLHASEASEKAGKLEADRKQAQFCADERSRIDALGDDLEGLRSALGGLTCAGVRKEAQEKVAALEAERKQAQVCADERSRVNALGGNLEGIAFSLGWAHVLQRLEGSPRQDRCAGGRPEAGAGLR